MDIRIAAQLVPYRTTEATPAFETLKCQRSSEFPRWRQEIFPAVAMDFPMDGHEISPPDVRWGGA